VDQAGADLLRIAETAVLVVVDEELAGDPACHPAWPLCRGLGALGFGVVELRGAEDDGEDFSLLMRDFSFLHGSALGLGRPRGRAHDIVLHLGNDSEAREACAHLARSGGSLFASLRFGSSWVEMDSLEQVEHEASKVAKAGGEPCAPIAWVAAGLALQEALIVAGGLEEAVAPESRVCFDAARDSRARDAERSTWPPAYIESAVLDVIGAGAVGTQLLECLAPLLGPGCELRIFDFDHVGPENLAMQPVYSAEDVGQPKAIVMAEKLAPLCHPGVDVQPMALRYEDRPRGLSQPTLRLACPDSFAARRHANGCSLRDGAPLVEAGSSPLAAQQRTYLPGRTACLEHSIPNLSLRAASEQRGDSCSAQPALTLPGTNMICAGMLAAGALRALSPATFGDPSRGTLVYDARFQQRFGVVDVLPPCAHDGRDGPGP
jgi:molybdopterin/thiamine biosynthesis adenylyltransferase